MTGLKAEKREAGKAAQLRREGLMPAVIYGPKEPSTSVAVSLRDFEKVFHEAGESSVIELTGLGDSKDVLIHDVTVDPLTGTPMHADFYAIEKGKKVTVSVPLEFVGVSTAVKDLGGILGKVMHELEIEAQVKDLPHRINVDISMLSALDSQIHVSDIKLPAGVETTEDPNEVIAMISVAKEEEAAPQAIDITQIEMSVEKGKKEEEGAEGEAAK